MGTKGDQPNSMSCFVNTLEGKEHRQRVGGIKYYVIVQQLQQVKGHKDGQKLTICRVGDCSLGSLQHTAEVLVPSLHLCIANVQLITLLLQPSNVRTRERICQLMFEGSNSFPQLLHMQNSLICFSCLFAVLDRELRQLCYSNQLMD